MTGNKLREKYLNFFKNRGHQIVPSSPLVPQNDPTTLFTGSGMQPMLPYLLGESHPLGDRIVDSQVCFRTEDIEEVGDNRHDTLFEMLGNWSLGSYWKTEQLNWFFEFLTKELGLAPERLYVSVFSGDEETNIPKDTEAIAIWKEIFKQHNIDAKDIELVTEDRGYKEGMQGGRIFTYGVKKNWWSRAGVPSNMPTGEPGGPDSEVFYDFGLPHNKKFGENCHPNCDCGRFVEIGNCVFMTYKKLSNGTFEELKQKNVDFGGGFERILAACLDNADIFQTDLYQPIIKKIEEASGKNYSDNPTAMQVITDHLKAAVFMINQGLTPGNKQQSYILRRLIRRSVVKMQQLNPHFSTQEFAREVYLAVGEIYKDVYFQPDSQTFQLGLPVLLDEVTKFEKTLAKGLKILEKSPTITGKVAFDLLSTYGFPWELTVEIAKDRGHKINEQEFKAEFEKHQELSRSTSKGMFKGGLADHSETVTKYHTATHLLHQSLRLTLGTHVQQTGSNITSERLRFDFTHAAALTPDEIKKVEDLINAQISANLPVTKEEMDLQDATAQGALAFFGERYATRVSVYSIGNFSKEVCGGPHVTNTGEIGPIVIFKQEAIGAGRRRLYAKLKT